MNQRVEQDAVEAPTVITDRPHIIETGTESYRFRRTLEKRKGQTPQTNTTTAPPLLAAEKRESKTAE